jgi:hypothetical protein
MPKVAPEKARYRPVYLIGMPVMLLLTVAAVPCVLVWTSNALFATPMLYVVYQVGRRVDRAMDWLSTPSELMARTPNPNAPSSPARPPRKPRKKSADPPP